MTKEILTTNAECRMERCANGSSFVIRISLLAIRAYQLTISPALAVLFGETGGCRFTPTCSQYAAEAVREHGTLAGGVLAARRICRCHPWGGCGHDPVPKKTAGGRQKPEAKFGLGNVH